MARLSNIEIKKLQHSNIDDLVKVIDLFVEVFEMRDFSLPGTDHLNKTLKRKDFHVFAAFNKQKMIGALSAYELTQYYSEKPLAYIFDLAVVLEFQRQGVGGYLIEYSKEFFKENGFEEVFVQADQAEQYAVDFYRSTLPTKEEKVVHFYYTLNT